MDANLDVGLAVWRRYLQRAFRGLTLVYDPRPIATHARGRTIDVGLVSRTLNPVRWFKGRRIRVVATPDSDHRSIIVRLRRR